MIVKVLSYKMLVLLREEDLKSIAKVGRGFEGKDFLSTSN